MKTCHGGAVRGTHPQKYSDLAYPEWFTDFLADRAIGEPSPRTTKAYRQDFDAIAAVVAGTPERVVTLQLPDLTKEKLRAAFAA